MTEGGQNDLDLFASTVGGDAERYCPTCDSSFPMAMLRCPNDGTSLVALADDENALIGLEIDGRFTIESKLGKGGMGGVYAAVQHSIGRAVAIKVIHGHLSRDRNSAKRFLRETKLASRLSHPNTVTVIDFGQTADHRLYMVMEMVEGVTLSTIIRHGALPSSRARTIAIQICDALEAAAKLQIVHRDLKPANIMIKSGSGGGDFVKVLDFGLAKSLASEDSTVTESHMIVGTPHYLPPELALGDPVDTRSDLYSLGVVMYAMVAGQLPFRGDTVQAVLFSQVNDPPPPLPASVPKELANVIFRLLAKRPDLRFQSARETRDALVAVRDGDRVAASAMSASPPTGGSPSTGVSSRSSALDSRPGTAEPSGSGHSKTPDSSLFPSFGSEDDATAPKGLRAGQSQPSPEAATNVASVPVPNGAPTDRRWLVPVALLALVAAGVGGLFAMQKDSEPETLVAQPSDEATVARESSNSAGFDINESNKAVLDAGSQLAPQEPQSSSFSLKSRPSGAMATIAGAGSCLTPCSLEVAFTTEFVTVAFAKAGFQRAERNVTGDRAQAVVGELVRRRRPNSKTLKNAEKAPDTKPRDDFIPSYED